MDFTTADLHGMIYDHHNQVCSGVLVSVDKSAGLFSDINGRFTLPNLPKGKHEIQLKKEGYEDACFTVDFQSRTQILYLRIFSFDQILELAEEALKQGKIAGAEEYLIRAEKIKAGDPLLLYLKAVIALKRNQPEEALQLLLSILDQAIIEPYVYLTIADIYEYKMKDRENALKYLKKYAHFEENEDILSRIKNLEGQ